MRGLRRQSSMSVRAHRRFPLLHLLICTSMSVLAHRHVSLLHLLLLLLPRRRPPPSHPRPRSSQAFRPFPILLYIFPRLFSLIVMFLSFASSSSSFLIVDLLPPILVQGSSEPLVLFPSSFTVSSLSSKSSSLRILAGEQAAQGWQGCGRRRPMEKEQGRWGTCSDGWMARIRKRRDWEWMRGRNQRKCVPTGCDQTQQKKTARR